MTINVMHFDITKRGNDFYLVGNHEEYYLPEATDWDDAERVAKEYKNVLKTKHPNSIIVIN